MANRAQRSKLQPAMARQTWLVAALMLAMLFGPAVTVADELDLLGDRIDGERMMRTYLQEQIGRHLAARERAEDERLAEPVDIDAIKRWRDELRQRYLDAIGGLPETGTPLNAETVDVIERDGFRVEKVIYESKPGVFVTGALFLPDDERFEPPYPAVLVACGHARGGKANDGYQRGSALAALNGMAALLFDPIDQGERMHLLDDDGRPELWSGRAHNALGVGAIVMGRNPARQIIHDMVRSLDYLQQRPDIDGERLGVMGNSGGGTQTALIMGIDERVKAAAPSCYITSFERLVNTIGPQDNEQNIFGQLAFGMDHVDFLTMRAPTPVMVCARTEDFFDIDGTRWTVERARQTFAALGAEERIALTEAEGEHGWHQSLREASVQWMARWLRGVDQPTPEPEGLEVLDEQEIQVTEHGQVMQREGAVSVFEMQAEQARQMGRETAARWAEMDLEHALAEVRQVLGVGRLDDLPEPNVQRLAPVQREGDELERMLIEPEEGIVLPAVWLRPAEVSGDVIVYINDEGFASAAAAGGELERYMADGHAVLAVDLRGLGQTQGEWPLNHERFGIDGKEQRLAYLIGQSYLAMRVEDLLTATGVAMAKLGDEAADAVRLEARGDIVSVVGLHAAALERERFAQVRLAGEVESYVRIVEQPLAWDQLVHTVHGALRVYDLPLLREVVDERLVKVEGSGGD